MNSKGMDKYHEKLRQTMKDYSHLVYKITKEFPKSEIYGTTSQLRRSALSVLLNYVEGFARKKSAVMKNHFEIAYGSLKESDIVLEFAYEEGYVKNEIDYNSAREMADEIGAMLWKTIVNI